MAILICEIRFLVTRERFLIARNGLCQESFQVYLEMKFNKIQEDVLYVARFGWLRSSILIKKKKL